MHPRTDIDGPFLRLRVHLRWPAMHRAHLSSSPAISGHTSSFESSYSTFGFTSISPGGSWETRALSSAESSALLIPVSLVDAGPLLAALRAFLRR